MERTLASALQLWQRFTITRYFAASVIALGFDLAIFWSLISFGVATAAASAAGYLFGIIIHWMVSANIVFPGKTREGSALLLQRALFAGSALLGLGITVGIVAIASSAGLHAMAAKGLAVFVSFFAVYAVRKWGIFK
jgi:putative flippase GtrA